MFRHVVLLKWVETATVADRDAVRSALLELPAAIPELRNYVVGDDAGLEADRNFDFAIVADFDDVKGYETYRDHPTHQDVIARLIRPILASRAAVQHEL